METKNIYDGTAFFVVNKEGRLFVVTARHVAEQKYDLHARVPTINKKTGETEVILLKLPRNRWVYHPERERIEQVNTPQGASIQVTRYVDVATMKIKYPHDKNIKAFQYCIDESDKCKENNVPVSDIEPPVTVLVFGFPADIGFELLEQRPFGRLGMVAMTAGKKFLKMDNNK